MIDLAPADAIIEAAIADGAFPGACYAVGHGGKVAFKAFGRFMYCPESEPVRIDTIWDLASVSKVFATTTAAMLLVDDRKLDLDRPVAADIPAFAANGKDKITPRNLLVHDSGLAAFRGYQLKHTVAEDAVAAIYAEPLTYPTGTKTVYSDLGIITLANLIAHLSGTPFDKFVKTRLFEPLGLTDTVYNPDPARRARCAPTETVEPWRTALRKLRGLDRVAAACPHPDAATYIQGEVHDPNAMLLGGVAGHAGLFSTAGDLAKFLSMLLSGGGKWVEPDTVALFTKRQSEASSRGLGWDTRSAEGSSSGSKFSMRSFGHTGYTGTSVWCDPERGAFVALLANRVHPSSENLKIAAVRPKFHDAVASVWDESVRPG